MKEDVGRRVAGSNAGAGKFCVAKSLLNVTSFNINAMIM